METKGKHHLFLMVLLGGDIKVNILRTSLSSIYLAHYFRASNGKIS